ncbi:MAG TPA: hemerythrin domain-containing protein [Nitrospirales bacterium]|nr:hemerythrin domain-containing protein [Nitrospirales bacterium]
MKQQRPQTKGGPDAVEMLDQDHHQVEAMFEKFESAGERQKADLAEQIFHELEIHSTLEEEIFYPALRDQVGGEALAKASPDDSKDESAAEKGEDLIEIFYEEHKAVKESIEELRGLEIGDEQYDELFQQLKDDVLSHASDEEETVFPVAKEKLDTRALGARMQKRKDELLGAAAK